MVKPHLGKLKACQPAEGQGMGLRRSEGCHGPFCASAWNPEPSGQWAGSRVQGAAEPAGTLEDSMFSEWAGPVACSPLVMVPGFLGEEPEDKLDFPCVSSSEEPPTCLC